MFEDGYVCDNEFYEHEARVACMEMGYVGYDTFEGSKTINNTNRFTLTDLNCESLDNSFSECTSTIITDHVSHTCGLHEGIHLTCLTSECDNNKTFVFFQNNNPKNLKNIF